MAYDVSSAAMERAAADGAKLAGSNAEVGAAVQVALLSLPLPAHVVEVVTGDLGLLARPAKGLVVVDTSTVDPSTTRQLAKEAAAAGVEYLDAPVLGRPDACGRWSFPVGGNPAALTAIRPVLEPLAHTIIHVGESGAGNTIKLLNTLIFGAINAITAETFAAAARLGVAPRKFYETIAGSDAATVSNLFRELGPKILNRDFSPVFTLDLLHKDNSLAMAMLEDAQASVIVGNAVRTLNGLARAAGYGSEDTSAMVKVYETLLGVEIGANQRH
jgi:3-hydroxyisobutyrate dehydrogenase-like beta-hydroxyacid dehydrogenase